MNDSLKRLNPSPPRLIWKYSPVRTVTVALVFIGITATAGYFLYRSSPFITLIPILFFLYLMYQLLKSARITVYMVWPNLRYEYRSIFRKKTRSFPSWDVKEIYPDVTSMWKGIITERLVMEAGGEKLILTPFYNEGSEELGKFYEELHALPSSLKEAREEVRLEKEAAGILVSPGEPEQETVRKMFWSFIEMSINCPGCDGPVMINGPFTRPVCPGCNEEIDFRPDIWTDLLEDVRGEVVNDLDEGEGRRSNIFGIFDTTIYFGRLVPYCKECERDFDMDKDYKGGDTVRCPGCGAITSVLVPPEWFNNVFEGVKMLVGAESVQTEPPPPEEKRVLYMTCPNCGASTVVKGKTRLEKCDHCGTSMYLPDGIWKHFHPVTVKERWFVGFEAEVTVKKE